jgi:hypothetical protein
MTTSLSRRACAVAALAAALAVAPSALAQPAPPAGAESSVDADELYRQGIQAFKDGKLPEAYDLLSRAWHEKQSVDIAANLGVVEAKLEKWTAAAEHLSYALQLYPVGGDQDARAVLEQRYREARRKVGAVRVSCDGQGADVSLDGQELGKAPITTEKFVEPGQRKFTAVLDGFEPGQMTVTVEPGSELTIEIKMGPKKPGKDHRGPKGEHGEKPIWPIFVLAGVGAAGIGSGIGLLVMSESAKGDIEDSPCRSQSCAPQYQDQVDSYNLGRNAGAPLLTIGGLSLAGMIVYLAWPSPKDDGDGPADVKKSATWILPSLGPNGGGLTVGGEF